eukprot:GHVR01023300.1.p1 GENE.GHVR01023300.1~~GHVR01023300.1.p1  ORF type:complete len:331 (+),score=85.95 GHVR01023300.1:141-1133(+)
MFVSLLPLILATTAHAWSPQGHYLISRLAVDVINIHAPGFNHLINYILDLDTVEMMSIYADEVRPFAPHTSSWHFIEPDEDCQYKQRSDCSSAPTVRDSVVHFTFFLNKLLLTHFGLTTPPLVTHTRGHTHTHETPLVTHTRGHTHTRNKDVWGVWTIKETLSFIIHFTADLHDLMHTGKKSDEGGTCLKGSFFGKFVSLHKIWDSSMLEAGIRILFKNDREKFYNHVLDEVKFNKKTLFLEEVFKLKTEGVEATVDQWTGHQVYLSCEYGYKDAYGNIIYIDDVNDNFSFNLGEDYFKRSWETLKDILVVGAVRTAALIYFVVESLDMN